MFCRRDDAMSKERRRIETKLADRNLNGRFILFVSASRYSMNSLKLKKIQLKKNRKKREKNCRGRT